jgi:methylglutaconyl-CoA hydratase
MTFDFLEVQRQGTVERVTLSRPDVRNAFNPQVIAELHAWAQRTAACESTHVVVIAGAGTVFSAGADLEWMARGVDRTYDEVVAEAQALHDMFTAIDQLPQAVIGRVHGAAIAGGAGLLAVCDAVVAADDTVFGFSEVKLGIVPAIISPFVIAKIGASAARELFVTGARFNAMRAREIGLVHRVVPFEQLNAAVDEYVAEISSANPAAMAAAKALVRNVAGRTPATAFEVTGAAIAARRVSADARAEMRAFLDKRSTRGRGND